MKLSEHKDLKIEILAMPPKEKDKLLLRLVAKDKVLTEHLHFLLLEDESNLRDRISFIKNEIVNTNMLLSEQKYVNAKDVLVSLRKLAKMVNHNLRVTKANFEDVELRVFLYQNTFIEFKKSNISSYKNYDRLFNQFFVKSVLVTLRKFDKLHEDLQFDLKQDFNRLLTKIYTSNLRSTAIDLGLTEQL